MDIQSFCERRNISSNLILDLKDVLEKIEANCYGQETKVFDESSRKHCYKTLVSLHKEMTKNYD